MADLARVVGIPGPDPVPEVADLPDPPSPGLLGGPGVVEPVVRLAYGPLVGVGGHVVDVHPDSLVSGRGNLKVFGLVAHHAALLDAGHVPRPRVSPVVSLARLDDGLGHE